MHIAWRQGFHKGATSGPTHGGLGAYATPTETFLRNRLHFARVYGVPDTPTLLGRQDYVFMQHTLLANGKHKFDMIVYKNHGFGATKLPADGDKYCNMVGHSDGREDYVWTFSTGRMTLFPNAGKKHISGSESFWDLPNGPAEVIWTPPAG